MKRMFAAVATLLGLAGTAPVNAEVDINIGIGIPGLVYTTPNHPGHGHYHRPTHPHSPRVIITEPRVIVVPGEVWYGDARDYDRPRGRDFHHGRHHRGKHHHPGRGRHRD